jgi:Zn finger protein HypA/HybF involved in hydrogenase expression
MPKCPKCGSSKVQIDRTTLPDSSSPGETREAYDYRCLKCQTLESMAGDDVRFQTFLKRWHGVSA